MGRILGDRSTGTWARNTGKKQDGLKSKRDDYGWNLSIRRQLVLPFGLGLPAMAKILKTFSLPNHRVAGMRFMKILT